MKLLQVPSVITKITTMADKSLRLQVDTQELNAVNSADVFQYYNNDGKENPIIKGEVGIDNARNLLVYYFE